jgi:hypothetical protein
MKIKTLGLALVALVALGAVLASSAFATPVTKKSQWESGAKGETAITGTPAVKCSKRGEENFTLKGVVLGAETELTATNVECKESTIFNKVVSSENMAEDAGRLNFTGVTVMKPAGCSVTGGEVTTEPLSTRLEMDSAGGGTTYDRFEPTAGATGKFASIKIAGCAIAGTYPVTGVTYGKATNETGVLATNQPLVFNATTNGFGTLMLAGKPATITGEANNELVSGEAFRATEK